MPSLHVKWDNVNSYDLWSWNEVENLTAIVIKQIKHRVYTAHLGPYGQPATNLIIIKTARGRDEMVETLREYEIYCKELKNLQGIAVPRCYGFFKGKVDGIDLGMLLLEYCGGRSMMQDSAEFGRLVMMAVCRIHNVGIQHGDLMDGHHIVVLGKEVRIVDFTKASRHRCKGCYPTLNSGVAPFQPCGELVAVENSYGLVADLVGHDQERSNKLIVQMRHSRTRLA